MCIICIKKAGIDLPKESYIENMWYSNPDGAGFMYAYGGSVHIEKGFMKIEDFKNALSNLDKSIGIKNIPLIIHCRITTHGGTKPENCHPFPISDQLGLLTKLKSKCDWGVAHNGILSITPRKGISDTMEYVLTQLSIIKKINNDFMSDERFNLLISNATDGSKLAFMNGNGEIYTTGLWTEDDGYLFSNSSYKYSAFYKYTSSKYLGCAPLCDMDDAGYYLRDKNSGDYIIDEDDLFDYCVDKHDNLYKFTKYYDGVSPVDDMEIVKYADSPGWTSSKATTFDIIDDYEYTEDCAYCGKELTEDEMYYMQDGTVLCKDCADSLNLTAYKI